MAVAALDPTQRYLEAIMTKRRSGEEVEVDFKSLLPGVDTDKIIKFMAAGLDQEEAYVTALKDKAQRGDVATLNYSQTKTKAATEERLPTTPEELMAVQPPKTPEPFSVTPTTPKPSGPPKRTIEDLKAERTDQPTIGPPTTKTQRAVFPSEQTSR